MHAIRAIRLSDYVLLLCNSFCSWEADLQYCSMCDNNLLHPCTHHNFKREPETRKIQGILWVPGVPAVLLGRSRRCTHGSILRRLARLSFVRRLQQLKQVPGRLSCYGNEATWSTRCERSNRRAEGAGRLIHACSCSTCSGYYIPGSTDSSSCLTGNKLRAVHCLASFTHTKTSHVSLQQTDRPEGWSVSVGRIKTWQKYNSCAKNPQKNNVYTNETTFHLKLFAPQRTFFHF